MKKFLVRVDKTFVYDPYFTCMDNPIEYDNITRFKAHESTHEFILNNIEKIEYLLSPKDMGMYVDLVNNKMGDYVEADDFYEFLSYYQTSFLFNKYELIEGKHRLYMPEEIKQYFSTYIQSKEMADTHIFQLIIKGFVETHGVIRIDIIEDFFHQEHEIESYMSIKSIPFLTTQLFLDGYYIVEEYMVHESIIDKTNNISPYGEPDIKSFDDYFFMGLQGMTREQYNQVQENPGTIGLIYHIEETTLSDLQFSQTPIEDIIELIEESNIDEIVGEYFLNYPLWIYGGKNALEIMISTEVESHTARKRRMMNEVLETLQLYVYSTTNLKLEIFELLKYIQRNSSVLVKLVLENTALIHSYQNFFYESLKDILILEEAIVLLWFNNLLHIESKGNYYTLSTDLIDFNEDSYEMGDLINVAIIPTEYRLYIVGSINKVLNNKIDHQSLKIVIDKLDSKEFIADLKSLEAKKYN